MAGISAVFLNTLVLLLPFDDVFKGIRILFPKSIPQFAVSERS